MGKVGLRGFDKVANVRLWLAIALLFVSAFYPGMASATHTGHAEIAQQAAGHFHPDGGTHSHTDGALVVLASHHCSDDDQGSGADNCAVHCLSSCSVPVDWRFVSPSQTTSYLPAKAVASVGVSLDELIRPPRS